MSQDPKLEAISNDQTPNVPNKLNSNLVSRFILNFEIVLDFDIRIWHL
jgi:hypothetical protein